jgi:isoleucyl-tRNA synthetase
MLDGFRIELTPGWDCHGLPIELKAVSDNYSSLTPIEIRQKAKQLALNVIEEQKKSFMSWGVMADWDNPYFTFDSNYIKNQINAFYKLYEKGLVFRDYMPVYWSPSTRTALAEAELQYNDSHISKSVYVKLKLIEVPQSIRQFGDVYAVIWTTTPWTLAANEAIAYATNQNYAIVTVNKLSSDYLLVAYDLIPALEKQFDSQIDIKHIIHGSELKGVKYTNPIALHNESQPFIESSYVTITKGTGLVHIAPNHGLDDYKLIIKHNIPLKDCIVDESGCYVSAPNSSLNNKFVLTEGNESIVKELGTALLFKHDFTHSYPYDWRSKKPVIVRASPQWFINIDAIRDDCIKALENVKFYPDFFKKQLINQIRIRPNWCISRQRSWGVPIPVFYKTDDISFKTPIITEQISNHISKLIHEKGYDIWWKSPVEQLLPNDILKKILNLSSNDLVKGKDIFDIWFDSGMSWKTVLNEPQIADIYLEGVDQLRGWFQSSLILSVALRNCSPYKSVLIHGFAVDKDGKKMSKSIGNVIDPNSIIQNESKPTNNCGVDGLRWWTAAHASSHDDVAVSLITFEDTLITINKIRNVLRFMIGSLNDFNAKEHVCNLSQMNILDKYMLHLLHHYLNDIKNSYENLKLSHVIITSTNFIVSEISAFYCTRIKHRLYCKEKYSLERRSCQTVLLYLYNSIVHELSPILPHIMIEANKHLSINEDFIINDPQWDQQNIDQNMKLLLSMIDVIAKQFPNKHLIQYDLYIKTSDQNCLENLSVSLFNFRF